MTDNYDFDAMPEGHHETYTQWILYGIVNPLDLKMLKAYVVWRDARSNGEYSRKIDAIQGYKARQEKMHREMQASVFEKLELLP